MSLFCLVYGELRDLGGLTGFFVLVPSAPRAGGRFVLRTTFRPTTQTLIEHPNNANGAISSSMAAASRRFRRPSHPVRTRVANQNSLPDVRIADHPLRTPKLITAFERKNRLNMKVRIFPDALIFVLAILGVLSLLNEAWQGPASPPLVKFLLTHHLWHVWNELRWQHMYSHEILHFLSGVVGSVVGCWIYFAFQKRRA